jgi:hypothetical protein
MTRAGRISESELRLRLLSAPIASRSAMSASRCCTRVLKVWPLSTLNVSVNSVYGLSPSAPLMAVSLSMVGLDRPCSSFDI